MTARKSSADDLVDAPFLDDAERADFDWLLAREADPAARPPSAKIANDYAELEDLLGNLPEGPPDDSWHDEVSRSASSSAPASRPWWRRATARWAIGGAFVVASAVAAWLLIPRTPAELEVAIRSGDPARGDPARGDPARGDPARGDKIPVGDHLVVKARPGESAELRVYRSGVTLVARCPGGLACTGSAERELTLEVALDAPGKYQVILVVGPIRAALDGTMNAYLEAARAAHARIVTYAPIYVE